MTMKPFLSGVTGGAAMIGGLVLAIHSAAAYGDRNWGLFALEVSWAAIIAICGLLFLLRVMEL
jgi:hypothetical protein